MKFGDMVLFQGHVVAFVRVHTRSPEYGYVVFEDGMQLTLVVMSDLSVPSDRVLEEV